MKESMKIGVNVGNANFFLPFGIQKSKKKVNNEKLVTFEKLPYNLLLLKLRLYHRFVLNLYFS